ncbi:NAD(P)H-dependent oxidoreductase [Cupriavidus pinatubonensis]|uniref:NAD(P)H-dependent oxidoreductase n=1 Tax=Cupriavidus pinatubonensis TaxID=248026 RepID=UPI00360F1FA0
MNVLLVLAQPDPKSLSAAVADAFCKGVAAGGHTAGLANLVAEGFEPRQMQVDLDCYHGRGPPPVDVVREQQRVDRADALVLVFPIYWWSMPAVLKGWIDRVFIRDWAFNYVDGKVVGALRDIPVHILAVGGGDAAGYEKYGYETAFNTQVEVGIFRFCGIKRVQTHLMLDSESRSSEVRERHLQEASRLGEMIAAHEFELS